MASTCRVYNLKNKITDPLKFILTLYSTLFAGALLAQRTIIPVNNSWQFSKENKTAPLKWETVNLPHTWNAEDVMDDVPGYYRGAGFYKHSLFIDEKYKDRQLFLLFEGASQVAEVFVNGKKAGGHTGGYAAFYIPLMHLVNPGKENEILVKVDNSYDQDIPPLSADFTFYGGLYRDVWLLITDPVHFSVQDNTKGIYISTPRVDAGKATVQVKAVITNNKAVAEQISIASIIKNKSGRIISRTVQTLSIEAGSERTITQLPLNIRNPQLWSPESPYLYTVTNEIRDKTTGKLLDGETCPLGIRWFHFDAEKGFFLNGKACKLIGTSRHQDYKGMGNAVPDSLAVKDIVLIKKMGGNFLRVAHYPQDPSVLAACDSLGILTSVEIPVVNEITETENFYNNCMNMQVEMIRQHFNHPSVIIWCYMNEVLLKPHYNAEKEKQKLYFRSVAKLAKSLDSITRKEDPSRYTMMAHHGDYNRYNEAGLINIPMITGWNLYSGWYGPKLEDFPVFLDSFHTRHPSTPVLVSEYGADADPRIRSTNPVRFDKSVEYTTLFHQYYLTEMLKRPFVAAAMIWNLADFNSETRTESMPHINNKGLMEWNRKPKDPYYYYEAMLSKKPFIKILGTQPAAGMADSNNVTCSRLVQAATNIKEAELFVNGKTAGKRKTVNGLCEWVVPFINGNNDLEIKGETNGGIYNDKAGIQFLVQPRYFDKTGSFQPLNILLGANRYFTDDEQQLWIPDKLYQKGSWGHTGGRVFRIPNNGRLPYGTDKSIAGTENDPVYQTQQIGIETYKLDLPRGEYELKLHFAELLGGIIKEIPYNLSDPDRIEPNGKRVFNVYVNGKLLLDNFDITAQYGPATAVAKTTKIAVTDDSGIEVSFKSIEGEPVLNAIQIRKIESVSQQPQLSTGK